MQLSSKDAITTILAGATAWVYWMNTRGISFNFLLSTRWASVVVLVLGLAMCAAGSSASGGGKIDWSNSAMAIPAVLGILSGLAGVLAIITGNKAIFTITVALILVLWLYSTIRHLVS